MATLLVAVVGATFAYFTATNNYNDTSRGAVDVKTAKVSGATLTSKALGKVGNLDYPGGVMVTATSVTVGKQDSTDKNNYDVSFGISLKGTNGMTGQDVKWYLIRTEQPKGYSAEDVSDVAGNTMVDKSIGSACKLKSEEAEGLESAKETHYYYGDCSAATVISSKLSDGVLVGYGTLTAGSSEAELVSETGEEKLGEVSITRKSLGLSGQVLHTDGTIGQESTTTYTYYLVIEFPNSAEESQNGELNENFDKQISISFEALTDVKTTVKSATE